MANSKVQYTADGSGPRPKVGEVIPSSSRSTEDGCDELTYEWFLVEANLAGFDYVDENENDQFDIDEEITAVSYKKAPANLTSKKEIDEGTKQ